MKKALILSILLPVFSNIVSASDKFQPYIGASFHSFSIGQADKGSSQDFTLGVLLNDRNRINISHFTGNALALDLLKVTFTSLSINHSFNGSGIHRGFFLGAAYSNIKIENKSMSILTLQYPAASSDNSGVLFSGGYEYKFDNRLFLDVGIYLNAPEVDYIMKETASTQNDLYTKFSLGSTYLSLNYVF